METMVTTDGREERGDRTRTALLEAARGAFADRGYAAASVRDIAAAADVNPGLIRYHFGSKAGLFAKVIEEAMTAMRADITAAVIGAGSPAEAGRRGLSAYLDHLEQNPEFPRLILRGVLDEDPVVLDIVSGQLRPLFMGILPMVQALPDNPLGDAREMAVSLWAASVGPFLYRPLLQRVFGEDPLQGEALERRRTHLEALVGLPFAALEKP